MAKITPTQQERSLDENDFIVSKTDTKGRITYGNKSFIAMSGYEESELLNAPHNIIRHPDMPRVVFDLLWKRIQNKEEIFAFVKNLSKDGSYYWVFTNATASTDRNGKIIGYYSIRRKPNPKAITAITPIYKALLKAEKSNGLEASHALLNNVLNEIANSRISC